MIKYKVIYVDDEDSLLEIGKTFMERDPEIKVFTSNSPQEVLAIIMEDNPYDIVISDYQMPSIDGIELLKVQTKIFLSLSSLVKEGKKW
jgi:DNA-binding NtrC family response regulator